MRLQKLRGLNVEDALNAVRMVERIESCIDTEADWTQGASARSPDGRSCEPESDSASAWSLVGALSLVLNDPDESLVAAGVVRRAFQDELAGGSLAEYNDGHAYSDMLGLLERVRSSIESLHHGLLEHVVLSPDAS